MKIITLEQIKKYLAPKQVQKIGIVGTGIQTKEQLRHLKQVTICREVIVFGRDSEKLATLYPYNSSRS